MKIKDILLLEPFSYIPPDKTESEGLLLHKKLWAYIGTLIYKKYKLKFKSIFSIPLGLAQISSIVKEENVSTHHYPFLLDVQKRYLSNNEIEKIIRSFDYDEVWLSVGSPETALETLRYAKIIKKINSETKIIVGGMFPSLVPEIFFKHGQIDLLLRGSGEYAVRQYVKNPSPSNYSNIQGLCYKKNGETRISDNYAIEPNLEECPPFDFEGMCIEKYMSENPYCNIQYSRGCPFNCPFCAHTRFWGRNVRHRSVKNVMQELKVLESYGCQGGYISDSTFTINKKKLIEFVEAYEKVDLDLKLYFETRADSFDDNMAKICKKFNPAMVFYGAESGSPTILKNLRGKSSSSGQKHLQDLSNAVKIAKNNDYLVGTSWMIGLPGESLETIKETRDFIFKLLDLGLDYADVRILQVFPGTDYWENAEKWGLKLNSRDLLYKHSAWDNFADHHTEKLNSEQIVLEANKLKKEIITYHINSLRNK